MTRRHSGASRSPHHAQSGAAGADHQGGSDRDDQVSINARIVRVGGDADPAHVAGNPAEARTPVVKTVAEQMFLIPVIASGTARAQASTRSCAAGAPSWPACDEPEEARPSRTACSVLDAAAEPVGHRHVITAHATSRADAVSALNGGASPRPGLRSRRCAPIATTAARMRCAVDREPETGLR